MSNYEFLLEIIDGHPVIETDGNKILIDTGSPVTIHNNNLLYFLYENFNIMLNNSNVTINELSRLTNIQLTTLLGMDIISDYKVLFDYKNKKIIFNNKNDDSFQGTLIKIGSFMKIPVIELKINNQSLKFFLDSGAKHSYLLKNITKNYKSVGKIDDFYPEIGEFSSDSYKIDTEFDNNIFSVIYGVLPKELEPLLKTAEVSGVIGSDFFCNFITEIDMKNSILKYIKI